MGRIRSVLGSAWTTFVVIAICVGFLADIFSNREYLEGALGGILPMGAALLPYMALGGIVYSGGRFLWWLWNGDYIPQYPESGDSPSSCFDSAGELSGVPKVLSATDKLTLPVSSSTLIESFTTSELAIITFM